MHKTVTVTVGLSAKYEDGINGADNLDPESGMGGASGTRSKNETFLQACNCKPWSVETSCNKWTQMSG
jgi:hypothetical protein